MQFSFTLTKSGPMSLCRDDEKGILKSGTRSRLLADGPIHAAVAVRYLPDLSSDQWSPFGWGKQICFRCSGSTNTVTPPSPEPYSTRHESKNSLQTPARRATSL